MTQVSRATRMSAATIRIIRYKFLPKLTVVAEIAMGASYV
jgi:hypothetical protein